MKKLKFVIILLAVLIIVLPAFCVRSFGTEDIITNFDSYKGNGGSYTKLLPKVNSIAGVIASVGSVVSIIALVIIGIKYIMGSARESRLQKDNDTLYYRCDTGIFNDNASNDYL